MGPRVFVTGVGLVSAIGNGTEETLDSFRLLKPGIGKLSLFDSVHSGIPVAEVKLHNAELAQLAGIDIQSNPHSRNTLLALVAASQVFSTSGWTNASGERTGAIMATTVGGMDLNEQHYKSLLESDQHKHLIDLFDSADCAEKVAAHMGIRHHVTTISTACSSSANAIMLGARLIKNGRLRRVLVGGSDALTKFTLNGFFSLEILSATGCRPFDKDRNGLTIGEGAAVLVLESEETACEKNIICEVTGYANVNEAFHATSSSVEGTGAIMAMSRALETASLKPDDISYINAHGTGTKINDLSEGRAIDAVFGSQIPPVSSTKAFTGHTLGAAGAIEAVFSCLALKQGLVLPALNFTNPMPELSFQPQKAMESRSLKHVMSNSFGFGGSNTTLIFSKV
ncbi:MAG: beta-ketoacyl-[acyl-carrier-protein] synthase family protein [Bacteroidales bacterium]|nr:beta-ketoacyl-[acyl-carrier-protein] synthase family protein [Bacteroidales bacterium]